MKIKNTFRSYLPLILFIFMSIATFTFFTTRRPENTSAASLNNFKPGNIISDYTMSNYKSMSESDIQDFLKSKNSCNDTRMYLNSKYHHVKDGHFVCLADEVFGDGTNYGDGVANGQSAAHIIWQAAQDYKINPQVLIVLLQKEQGLITDTFPNSIQYRSATGYGCPDTAACDSKYYGFKNQIRKAASLFRTVLDGGWTNYPVGNNYIQYNPNAACGGSVVYIENRATSALYRYTPYQPNAGALAAGYGTTSSCGAYGNRNFYLYFYDWFGNPTAERSYQYVRIPDGEYYINSINGTQSIDVKDDEAVANSNNSNKATQKWNFVYNASTDDYIITNSNGKVLDVEGANTNDGADVHLWELNKTCAQRWKIVNIDGEENALFSTCSGKALTIDEDDNAIINKYLDRNTQLWKFTPVKTLEKEGMYTIRSIIDDGVTLDVSGGVTNAKDGSNVQIWEDNNTGAQRWNIKKTKDGYFKITNPQSGKALDVLAASTENNANVQLWEKNNTCAQKWKILKNNNGSYSFISACSNKVIDILGANTKSGNNVQIYSANNSKAQQWILEGIEIVEDGEYSIVSALSEDKAIDITANQKVNGTNIQLWDENYTTAQKWTVTYDSGTDYYSIVNPQSEKSIDAEAAGTSKGTNIHLWEKNKTCAQKWTIFQTDDGEYSIASACSNLVIDVTGADSDNGANIQLWKYNGTNAQKWAFRKDSD